MAASCPTRCRPPNSLPPMAVRMLRLGEETGQLPVLAGRVAEFYEAKLQRSLDRIVGDRRAARHHHHQHRRRRPDRIGHDRAAVGHATGRIEQGLVHHDVVKTIQRISVRPPRNGAAQDRAATRRSRGFTLVEMLVVITIIGLIMGLIGPRVLNYLERVQGQGGQDPDAELLRSALDLFYLDAGRFPSTVGRTDRAGAADARASPPGTGPISRAAPFPTIPGTTPMCTARPASAVPMTSCPTDRTARKAAAGSPPTSRSKT